MRSLLSLVLLMTSASLLADEIVMKGGQKIEGEIQSLKDGELHVGVSAGYISGLPMPVYKLHKVRFSNVRSIKFDGREDFFAVVKKNDEVIDATVQSYANGKLSLDGHAPIPSGALKAFVPSKPNTEGKE